MSDYILTSDGELMHYGVPGMKWGVRRATKQLSKATTTEQRDKAIRKLEKHRSKASAKIDKLNKKQPKLKKAADRAIQKNDLKAAKIDRQVAMYKMRAGRKFISANKATKLMARAMSMEAKSDLLKASSREAKAALAKNKKMIELFKEGINDINKELKNRGKRALAR